MLKKAYVEITNRCNLACSFCPKTKRAPRTMSAQEFGLVLSRLEGACRVFIAGGLSHAGCEAPAIWAIPVPARHGRAAAAP